MRVLFLTHRLPYAPNRGDRIRAYHLIREISRTADVHLVALAHDSEEWSHRDDLDGMTASTDVVRVSRVGARLAGLAALAGRRPLTHVLLHAQSIYGVLRQRLVATPPDVVLAYCSGMARYACEPILSMLPFVLDLVDVDSEKWRALAGRASGFKKWIFQREAACLRRFEIEAVTRAAGTTVVSERERTILEGATGGLSARVVPNGIDVESFAPRPPPAESSRVVFCGVFSYEPNEQAALWLAREVWPEVVRIRPHARLSIVGMEPTPVVRALTADSTIEVTGAVLDVRPYLWRSAVAVAPLAIARGLQNKVLEAVAGGLPAVITSQVSEGLPAEVQPACTVADTASTFTQALIQLLSLPAPERRRIAARADLRQLSWTTQLAPLVDLLKQAAATSSRS